MSSSSSFSLFHVFVAKRKTFLLPPAVDDDDTRAFNAHTLSCVSSHQFPSRGWMNFSFVVRPTKKHNSDRKNKRKKRKFLPFQRIFQFDFPSLMNSNTLKHTHKSDSSMYMSWKHNSLKHDPNQWAKAKLSIEVRLLFWSFTENT